jgi:hypothetical protein
MVFQTRCLCGNAASMDVRSFGRPMTCASCRKRYVVVWGIDPKTKSAMTVTFEANASAPRGFVLPAGMYELACPCGQRLFTRPRNAGKRVQCPVCSFWLKLEHSKDPQTLETRIRVVKSRLNQLPSVPAPRAELPPVICLCGESLRVESTEAGGQAHCHSCGRQFQLEMNHDTVTSCIVVDPSAAAVESPPKEKRGLDEDLSLDDFR